MPISWRSPLPARTPRPEGPGKPGRGRKSRSARRKPPASRGKPRPAATCNQLFPERPPAVMADDTASGARSIEDILARGYTVKTFEYLRQGWDVFTDNPVGFLGFTLALTFASQAVPLLAPVVGQVLSVVIQVVMFAGLAIVTWKQAKDGSTVFADFLLDWKTTAQLVWCTVVGLLLIVIGLAFLVLPGIYLLVAYTFSYLLLVDQRKGVWQALEGSRRVVNKHWWGVFGLTLVMLLLIGIGGMIGAGILGVPIGYGLSGWLPEVSLDQLPLALPATGVTINLGMVIGVVSGMMVGGAVGVAVSGSMLGAAYADIFGLAASSQAHS